MKNKKTFLILLSAVFLLNGITFKNSPFTVTHANGEVAISSIEAWKFAGGWDTTSSYVNDGVKVAVPGADTTGSANAWSRKAYFLNDTSLEYAHSLAANEKVSFEFSIGMYDPTTGNLISKSQNGADVDIIFAKQADLGGEICRVRIWVDSGGALNGSHAYDVFVGGNWTSYSGGKWLWGDATLESSFYFEFDKENIVSTNVCGVEGVSAMMNATGIDAAKTVLGDADKVYVAIAGDNGFTTTTEIVLKSFNDQSFANDGVNFTTDAPPVFVLDQHALDIVLNEEYDIPIEAFDILGPVSYSLNIGGTIIEGKKFTPTTEGELNVIFIATDLGNNTIERNLTFNVVNNISPPTFSSLPTITGREVETFENLVFDMPEIVDSTGQATVILKISLLDELIATLNSNSEDKFVYQVLADFTDGEYTFVYEATNDGGTTISEPINATFTLANRADVPFVTTANNKVIATYGNKGIDVKAIGTWGGNRAFFGVFDLSETFDFKFIVENPAPNDEAVSLHIENVDNPNYQAQFVVWAKLSGTDAPTNVHITKTGGNFVDYGNCGWIKRTVDDVENQYHFQINQDDIFASERTGGMQRIDNNDAYLALKEFMNECPSSMFNVGIDLGGFMAGPYSATVSEIDGQKLADPITWNDAKLTLKSEIPAFVALNEQLTIQAYAKDLRQDSIITLSGKDHENNNIEPITFVNGSASYTFTNIGSYHLVISTIGSNGNIVKIERDVVCKSSTDEIIITVEENAYAATYNVNESVTIAIATYSDNVVSSSIEVLEPDGVTTPVEAGSSYTFTKTGIFKIIYRAEDDATPTPNVATKEFTINVPDTTKPVVTITCEDTAIVNKEFTFKVTVEDHSLVETTVTVKKPDGTTLTLNSNTDTYSFTPEVVGEFEIKVIAEDAYANSETVLKTITVVEDSKPNSRGPIIVVLSVLGGLALVGGGVALFFVIKKKKS